MLRFYFRLSLLIMSLLTIFFSINSFAQTTTTVVEKKVILTPAPKSTNCRTVPAHWEGNIWVDTQNICTYTGRTEGAAWVQDYWACTTFTPDGNCTAWEYRPGHWVSTLP